MKSTDNVGITFANLVLCKGILHGVVNVTLGAYEFNPDDQQKKVEPSPVIVSRLRMDVPTAKALRDSLDDLLKTVEAGPGTPADVASESDTATNGATAKH